MKFTTIALRSAIASGRRQRICGGQGRAAQHHHAKPSVCAARQRRDDRHGDGSHDRHWRGHGGSSDGPEQRCQHLPQWLHQQVAGIGPELARRRLAARLLISRPRS